jgi:predicted dehydrogenase
MKVGVVGYGSIGKRHATNLKAMGHEVVVYDPAHDISGIRRETQIYETCKNVVIATPSRVHWGCIRAAAERGCNMLIEKPIATGDVMGLQASLDLAASNGAVVLMGNNLRFHPCVIKTEAWMPRIGTPLWAQFTCAAQSVKPLYLSDGVILTTGSHEVDLALHLLGPAKVAAAVVRRNLAGHDDIADFVLVHENGCQSSFHIDFVTKLEVRSFRIVGKERDIFCELPKRFARMRSSPKIRDQFYGIGSYDDDYIAEMEDFMFQCAGKDHPPTEVFRRCATGADGLETLKILLEVRKMAGLP